LTDHDHHAGHGGCNEHGDHAPPRSPLIVELRNHVPFSVSAVAIGLLAAGAICILGFAGDGGAGPHAAHGSEGVDLGHDHDPARLFFHLFHPAHMLFSAAATAAMFSRYDRSVFKAIVVGLIGAIGVCGISDIVLPHVSLAILRVQTPWHICVVEHPGLALPFAAVGVLMGIAAAASVARSTLISHSLHVLMSTMASIFYMVGPLGIIDWIDDLGMVFLFVIVAVMGPCCVSDIVFPLLMTPAGRTRFSAEPHVH
jgi:hypothetical protein